jgi:hypothetical protein
MLSPIAINAIIAATRGAVIDRDRGIAASDLGITITDPRPDIALARTPRTQCPPPITRTTPGTAGDDQDIGAGTNIRIPAPRRAVTQAEENITGTNIAENTDTANIIIVDEVLVKSNETIENEEIIAGWSSHEWS